MRRPGVAQDQALSCGARHCLQRLVVGGFEKAAFLGAELAHREGASRLGRPSRRGRHCRHVFLPAVARRGSRCNHLARANPQARRRHGDELLHEADGHGADSREALRQVSALALLGAARVAESRAHVHLVVRGDDERARCRRGVSVSPDSRLRGAGEGT